MSKSTKQAIFGLGFFAVALVCIAGLAANASHRHGLRIVILSGRRAEPGVAIPITVSVRDTDGIVRHVRVDFGDGRVEVPDIVPQACGGALTQNFDFTHAFDFTGYTTIKATVATGGCGARPESVDTLQTIEVRKVER